MKLLLKIILLPLLFFISVSYSQEKKTITLELNTRNLPFGLVEYFPKDKPVIGLALSGGGARALSQFGVLKALDEAGIETNVIVGTSMGSIVGGLYAAGFTIDELDSIALNTNWGNMLSLNQKKSRRELFISQKITEDRALFALRLDGLNPVLPTSFSEGQKLTNYLYLLTNQAPVHPGKSFDDLWIKYRAVCTDLITGDIVVLENGQLSRAMRASSSVTFFLEPVKWDDKLLVDGGLLSNIPVDITKENGADLIIAVNTTSPLHPKEKIDLPWYIADQVVSIPMKKLNAIQLSLADFVITPVLYDKSSTEFVNIDSLILLGYKSTLPVINNIKTAADSFFNSRLKHDEFFIKNIVFNNEKEKELFSLLNKYVSYDSVSSAEIKKDMAHLYETGKYKSISMEVAGFPDSIILKFNYRLNPVIKTIEAIGIKQIDKQVVESILSILINKPFNNRVIAKTISKILRHYRLKGYLLADFERLDFDELTGTLMLFFNEGLISNIIVKGNFTRETLITRELQIKRGEYFIYDKVEESLENLSNSGFFKDIAMLIVEEDGKNTLIIHVDEKPSGVLRFGFLADETYNAQFSLDIRDENIFGSGTEAGLFLYGGASNGAYIFEIKNHRILNTYLTYNASVYYKFSDINVYEDVPQSSTKTFSRVKTGVYNQTFYGISLSLGTQIEKFGNLIFTGKYQFDEIENIEGDAVEQFKTKLVSIGLNTTIDNMNKYPYPLSGLYFTGFYETAQSFLGGNQSFISIGMDFRYFFNLGKRSTLIPRIKIGFSDNTTPLSEQFFLGGMDSFLGMRENEFRGRQIFLTSLMYRLKLPFKVFFDTYIKLRYDLGNTWLEQSQIRFKDLRHGIGGILSFDTPIGPTEFAIGRSFLLNKKLPENPVVWGEIFFYFSIGYNVNISPASF
ncbi:MAG: patatin-like phospholipase family protein [Bacteroidetes bacterium]|nr:patatin-like phospholipase family protein [Bacteroidota bacterium]